ncbi:MAG: hypothetical protein M9899_04420 [Bdellovibrionaceae bacterium]|nr:hypothetical protein [Pseudobdellovibrionaceae bacterium]
MQSLLSASDMLEEVFSRKANANESRFCPPYFSPIPIYVSENDKTTFYEYCFHLLNNKKFIHGNKPVKAALYYLKLTNKPKIKDISKITPKGVMSRKSYSHAHKFIKNMKVPDIIKYKSVRDNDKNINYAVYFKKYIDSKGMDPHSVIISFVSSKMVEVTIGADVYRISPKF